MKAIARLSLAELTLLARDPGSLFFMVAFPMMLLVLNSGNDRLDIFVPSYMAMILAIGGIAALPGIMATYRERKVLRRLATTPVSPFALLAGQVVAQLVMGLAGSLIVVGTGVLAFGVDLPAHPLMLALSFVLCALTCCAIGFVIAAIAPRGRVADLLGMLVMFPMIFLAGAAIPREGLPEPLRRIGDYLPLSQGVTALRESWFGAPTATPLLILAGIIVVSTAVAAALFRWE
ncbi:ABC transporter permease [Nonomuraea sp. NN258]|uniref:ABC transporter permease n=1 Tax=Nonomuraea antri TaxID=2730852 RepID=UPI00156A18C6|nr:ABC transporter permease [Nonomuraea antri]NRQ31013.1 ABC transporter permease [Nonomuraea antri]